MTLGLETGVLLSCIGFVSSYVGVAISIFSCKSSLNAVYRDIPRILVDLSLLSRLALVCIYVLMLTIGYCLMLLVMSFNVPVLIAVCLGLTTGHIVFEMVGLPKLPSQY